MPGPTRRDFLKFGSLLPGVLAASRLIPRATLQGPPSGASLPNIIIFVFDAMSAKHLSLYGYPRKTSPSLERFARRATVYHQHYSAGNFTTPGTASLLTGLYPWSHHAVNSAGLIAPSRVEENLFKQLGKRYRRLAYSQNLWANYLFGQFETDIENVLSPGSFSVVDQVLGARFTGDRVNSERAFHDLLLQDNRAPASLVFGLAQQIQLYEAVMQAKARGQPSDIAHATNYPIFFRLQDVFDGMLEAIAGLQPPFVAYLHTWSPHGPYEPSAEFANMFDDHWRSIAKPPHVLSLHVKRWDIEKQRSIYDRYIANVDFEFGRLLDGLQARGILDQSYVVVTSDHGEMMERGDVGHVTPLLYEPVVRVPLIVSSPGQKTRRDIHLPTSSIDLLPTLLHLIGEEVPAWCEGQVLPGLGGPDNADASIFACEAKDNRPRREWTRASFALRKGKYKLTYYTGYEQLNGQELFELYDIQNDPEELQDLYSPSSATAQDLRRELLERVQAQKANAGVP